MTDQTPHEPRSATVRHLREAARASVENTSLRGVAREIGMSPMGLRNFLHGTEPYAPTLRRLRNWYVRYAALRSGAVHTEDATAALAVLVHDLAPAPRQEAAFTVLPDAAIASTTCRSRTSSFGVGAAMRLTHRH